MSITPNVIDPRRAIPPLPPEPQIDPAEKRRKRVYMAFGATAGIVLLIGVVYVGGRVFAGQRIQIPTGAPRIAPAPKVVVKAPPAVAASPNVALAPKIAQPPVVAQPPATARVIEPPKVETTPISTPAPHEPIGPLPAGHTWTSVTPEPGETYLQVIALAGKFVDPYVKELRGKGLHPLVAPSPLDGVYRILFGPFKNQKAREDERKELEAAGLQPMIQAY